MNDLNFNNKSAEQILRVFQQIDETLRVCLGALASQQQENNKTLSAGNDIAKENSNVLSYQAAKDNNDNYEKLLSKINSISNLVSTISTEVENLKEALDSQAKTLAFQSANLQGASVDKAVINAYPALGGLVYIRLQLTVNEELAADTDYIIGIAGGAPKALTPLSINSNSMLAVVKAETGDITLKSSEPISSGAQINISGFFLADFEAE